MHQPIGVAGQLVDELRLDAALDLWVAKDVPQLRNVVRGRGKVAQLLVDLREPIVLLRRLEERAGIRAVDDAYLVASASKTEKSRSLIASSMSRR
jgi:hypothetical protein